MKKIIAFGGSNSKASINKQLASYAASLVGNAEVEVLDLNDYPLPLYGFDLENEAGFPANVQAFSDKIEGADGIVLSLAEHNGSFSTAFKNIFDWVSRVEGKVFRDKPMLLLSTSPGPRGGASVLASAVAGFPYRGGNIIASLSLPSFFDNFSDGAVSDETLNNQLKEAADKLSAAL
ncbi:NAD(P)H-dependent oxidoreductase [Urechidicola sp. KH5]